MDCSIFQTILMAEVLLCRKLVVCICFFHPFCLPELNVSYIHWEAPVTQSLNWLKSKPLSDRSYLRGSLHSLKLGAPTLVCPPLAKILQTVLLDKQKHTSGSVWKYFAHSLTHRSHTYLCALKLVAVNKPGAHHRTCAPCEREP